MARNKVLFRFGSRSEYDSLQEYDSNSLYFLLDTNELYRGSTVVGKSHFRSGEAEPNETIADSIDRIIGTEIPVINDLTVVTSETGVDDLFIYTGPNSWRQLNATIRSESVIFNDGHTLDEVLQTVQTTINFNNAVLEVDDNNTLSLKDFGKTYYKYVPEVAAQGEEGDPDYVPAVPAHYEQVVVDASHPWISGLTIKTNAAGQIGWYEPNTDTAEGLSSAVANLRELVDENTRVNTQQTQQIEQLQELVGTQGDTEQGTPSTGLIKQVQDLRDLINAGGIQKITVDGVELVAMNGTANIPLFGENTAGAVPAFNTAVQSLANINRNHVLLSANGWTNPLGQLSYNNVDYNNVADYVDARVEASELKWQTINE